MEHTSSYKISIVCPVFNEADCIEPFLAVITGIIEDITSNYEIIFINDGSTDTTLDTLITLQRKIPPIIIIDLSRNFGKEAALTAGLEHASGDAVIPIDCDLQDPPELIGKMIAAWQQGNDVVLAKRKERQCDSLIKQLTAKAFYKTFNRISDISIPENVGDFRLMDKRVVLALRSLPENRRFMKGLFAWIGFKTTTIEYSRSNRIAGNTKFNIWKLWKLAIEAITSFSTIPLQLWTYFGLLVATISFIYGCLIITKVALYGIDVPGYASTLTAILFFGGVQAFGLGILGEYIGRIYLEAKNRPTYIVKSVITPPRPTVQNKEETYQQECAQ